MNIFQKKSISAIWKNKQVTTPVQNPSNDEIRANLTPAITDPLNLLLGKSRPEVPVLTEVVELAPSVITVEAVSKLIAECERYKLLLAQWEQYDFPEIVARCQIEMQTALEKGASNLVNNVSEKMSRTLRAELRVAMMQAMNEE